MKKIGIVLIGLLFYCGAVFADCDFNGKSYAEGTVLGPYTCKGGEWVKS